MRIDKSRKTYFRIVIDICSLWNYDMIKPVIKKSVSVKLRAIFSS